MGKTPKIFLLARKGELKPLRKKVPSTKHKITEEDPENKRTLLHYAAEGAKVTVGEYLLSVPGINVEARDQMGDTPLHVALRLAKTSEVHEDFALMLVKHGADIYADTKDWKTPIKLVEETNSNRFKVRWKEAVQFVSKQMASTYYPPTAEVPLPVFPASEPAKPPVNVLTTPLPVPEPTRAPVVASSNTTMKTVPAGAMPSLDELLDAFSDDPSVVPPPPPPPPVEPESTEDNFTQDTAVSPYDKKDLYTLWYDVGGVLCDLVALEANISNVVSSRRIEVVENSITALLTEMKEGSLKDEKFTPFQRTKINDAMDVMPERLKKLIDCVRLMSFSKADHTDVAKVTVPLVGATYWLYVVVEQVSKEEITKGIGGLAIAARTAVTGVATGGVPKSILPLAASLIISVSRRIYESKDPSICLQLSDACYNIAKNVKSLILVPMFAGSGASIEGVPILAKGIADNLQIIKSINTSNLPSRLGPPLSVDQEREVYTTAHKQLSIALEFYLSNAGKVPLPYPNTLVPLFKQQLSYIKAIPSALQEQPFDQAKFITTTKNLAACINSMCDIFLKHRIDFEEDEELWNNLLTVVNGARHFSIQILIASICVVTKNKICTRDQIAFATRGAVFCTTVIIDTFCLDL